MAFWLSKLGRVGLHTAALLGLTIGGIAASHPARATTPRSLIAQAPAVRPEIPEYTPIAPPPAVNPLPDARPSGETPVAIDPRIPALQRDYRGNLWVGGWRGLAQIDPNTGKILAKVNVPSDEVNALAEDKSGRLWVGTYEGLWRVDPRTKEITAANYTLPSNRVLSLQIDQRGYLWVGTDRGLALISPDKGLLMTTIQNLPGVSANALTLDAKGNLWVGTLEGVTEVDTAKGKVLYQIQNLPGGSVQTVPPTPWWKSTPKSAPSNAASPNSRAATSSRSNLTKPGAPGSVPAAACSASTPTTANCSAKSAAYPAIGFW
jgi:ligand-binding sensor domain-containing protein